MRSPRQQSFHRLPTQSTLGPCPKSKQPTAKPTSSSTKSFNHWLLEDVIFLRGKSSELLLKNLSRQSRQCPQAPGSTLRKSLQPAGVKSKKCHLRTDEDLGLDILSVDVSSL